MVVVNSLSVVLVVASVDDGTTEPSTTATTSATNAMPSEAKNHPHRIRGRTEASQRGLMPWKTRAQNQAAGMPRISTAFTKSRSAGATVSVLTSAWNLSLRSAGSVPVAR